ncbi:hypothetical protein M758_10G155900 [Ceratodon purpureus]|nr:hypothetical protein M758_10G155900 [Ceratodon purpureus]KAG0604241.1 hypothetical protein M758_10G155900 [Ceratodon purpureus]KAG0604242.1 hypothetical protein M758_10G155900 [Ceratodon purpureus]
MKNPLGGAGVLISGSKSLSVSYSQSSKIALVSAFSIVIMFAYWRNFEAEQGPRNGVFSALSSVVDSSAENLALPNESPLEPPVRKLIGALRREVLKVKRNTGIYPDTDFDLKKWKEENPCISRTELPSYYSRLSSSPNRKDLGISESRQWETVLFEYARLHRACIRAAGNITEYFYSRNTTTGCKFFIAEAKNGLGNKLFIMAPSVLYAILTQRVILIPESTGVPDLMCEPFPGSSWRLSIDIQNRDVPIWNQTKEFMDNVDRAKREHESTLPIYASRVDDDWLPVARFFCDVEQSYFRQVPWLTVHGCLYFLPKLFAIPSHQITLEALFPDPSVAITHILRTTFLPRDETWDKVKGAEYLFNSSHLTRVQVGIQARYFNSSEAKHKVINANVEGCLVENNLLEQAVPVERSSLVGHHETTIFIASLTSDLQEHLQGFYERNPESQYTKISFQQLSSEKEQRSGIEVYQQVLVEILWLSFSHTLLVSPASTFGGLGQAYGALTSWFIEMRDDVMVPCQRGQTSDGCFQTPHHSYSCPYETVRNGKPIFDFVPYIKSCREIDAGGLQLIDGLKNTGMVDSPLR